MDTSKKIQKLESFDLSELINIIKQIFDTLGLIDIQFFQPNILIGKTTSLLGSTATNLIYIQKEKLSALSSPEIQELCDKMLDLQTKHSPKEIYLITAGTLSTKVELDIHHYNPLINILHRDKLIELIDNTDKDIWRHKDVQLLDYEKNFKKLNNDFGVDIKGLSIFSGKYEKLLSIYIDPTIYHFYEDKATQIPARKKVNIDALIEEKRSFVISGQAGTGKSTLLKKIGENILLKNDRVPKKIPVIILGGELVNSEFDIEKCVITKIAQSFPDQSFDEILNDYQLVLLVDSIDEFTDKNRMAILKKLTTLKNGKNIKYIIASRDQEKLINELKDSSVQNFQIVNFNVAQIGKFISHFFKGDEHRAESLIEALKENRILERLPITPLTLSLISILYEEKNLEIPATIADIYSNFNSLIIGKLTVSSRLEFIDISFKERILSLYALSMLEEEEHKPMYIDNFVKFFKEYYAGKTLPIESDALEEILSSIVNNTGILAINHNKQVVFTHDSYMEYYAALEIFKHQRKKENLLVDNFYKHNWQNATIFYAGMSKDMPDFLESILEKIKKAEKIGDIFSVVYGAGYLLQALYQTDNELRSETVIEALSKSVLSYEFIQKLASDDENLFSKFKLPILQVMNLMFFYETFNSIAIKEPLEIAFEKIQNNYNTNQLPVDGYKLINLALTLDSKRLKEPKYLSSVIESNKIMSTPELYVVLDFSLGFWENRYNDLKKEIRKEYFQKIKKPIQNLIGDSVKKLRFTGLNQISTKRRITLIVEGKTDVSILEHAFFVLTDGTLPYWEIKHSGHFDSGCANEVAKCITNCVPAIENDAFIIGIFDHDEKGLQEYNGLKSNIFNDIEKDIYKKHLQKNVFAISLPIPGEFDCFFKADQKFNYFEVEHYFDKDLLENNNMIVSTPIDNIYAIKEKGKKDFAEKICKMTDSSIFRHFIHLFKLIDKITQENIDYIED